MKFWSSSIPLLSIVALQKGCCRAEDAFIDPLSTVDLSYMTCFEGERIYCEVSDHLATSGDPDSFAYMITKQEYTNVDSCRDGCLADDDCGMYMFSQFRCTHILEWGLEYIQVSYDEFASVVGAAIYDSLADTPMGTPTTPTVAPTRAPTRAPTAAPNEEPPAPSCFSESVTVETIDKGTIAMKDLRLGDLIVTGGGSSNHEKKPVYEPVYSFGHHHATGEAEFLQIYTNRTKSTPLEMTANHLVFQVNGKSGIQEAVRADSIEIGNVLVHYQSKTSPANDAVPSQQEFYAAVTKISKAVQRGLYMPLTPSGTIIVNGIKASTYVSIQDEAPLVVQDSTVFSLTEETFMHWILAPHRVLCRGISSKFCFRGSNDDPGMMGNAEDGILHWLVYMKKLGEFANHQCGSFSRVVLIGVPLFVLFGSLNLVESLVLGATTTPTILAMILGGAAVVFFWRKKELLAFYNSRASQKECS